MSDVNGMEICLICNQNNKLMVSLQEVLTGFESSVAQILQNLHFMTISDTASSHRTLCFLCVAKVQSCYDFKKKCSQAETVLNTESDNAICESLVNSTASSICNTESCDTYNENTNAFREENPTENNFANSESNKSHTGEQNTNDVKYPVLHKDILIQRPLKTRFSEMEFDIDENVFYIKEEKHFVENQCCKTEYCSANVELEDFRENIYSNGDYDILSRTEILTQMSNTSNNINITNEINEDVFEIRKKNGKKYDERKTKLTAFCPICNKGFESKCHLRVHLVVHTGERNYACDVCNKAFTQVSNLNRHKLIHSRAKSSSSISPKAKLSSKKVVKKDRKSHILNISNKLFHQT